MREWIRRIVASLGLLLIFATLLPIIPSNEWWIRLLDFPRAQIAALLFLAIVAAAAVSMWRTRKGLALISALILCFGYQISRIIPYTVFWSEQVPSVVSCPPGDRLSFMEANVLQRNRDARALLFLVKDQRPDVLLLTETDRWWADQVRPLMRQMPHVVSVPQDNTYPYLLPVIITTESFP